MNNVLLNITYPVSSIKKFLGSQKIMMSTGKILMIIIIVNQIQSLKICKYCHSKYLEQ